MNAGECRVYRDGGPCPAIGGQAGRFQTGSMDNVKGIDGSKLLRAPQKQFQKCMEKSGKVIVFCSYSEENVSLQGMLLLSFIFDEVFKIFCGNYY